MKKSLFKRAAAVMLAASMTLMTVACGQTAATGTTETEAAQSETASAETEIDYASMPPIQVATKPITEQYILGEMLKLVIEEYTPYKVEITKGIGGGTSNIMPAMEKGEFDLYPEYTSTGYVLVLEHDASGVSDEEIWNQLDKEYAEKYNMSWVGQYGFNNTYAVVVRKDLADEYGLRTVSDLVDIAGSLTFGGNPDYLERADGFQKVCDTYGLEFGDVKDIDIGLKYEALANYDIDVTNGYTTDAQLGTGQFVALEDDLHLQVNYYCSTVVRNETLEERPMLQEILLIFNDLISNREMAELNAQVEIEGRDEAEVAKEFLILKTVITE